MAIEAMTDCYYDIFVGNEYAGEIYARDIGHGNDAVKNLGYFIDKELQNKGYMTEAVLAFEDELWRIGVHRVCLFSHFTDPNDRNIASEKVALKCGYAEEGIARDAIKVADGVYACEVMFAKILTGPNFEK